MHRDWSIRVEIKEEGLNHIHHLRSAGSEERDLVMGNDDSKVTTKAES